MQACAKKSPTKRNASWSRTRKQYQAPTADTECFSLKENQPAALSSQRVSVTQFFDKGKRFRVTIFVGDGAKPVSNEKLSFVKVVANPPTTAAVSKITTLFCLILDKAQARLRSGQ